MITPLLRQNDVARSFWLNNDVLIAWSMDFEARTYIKSPLWRNIYIYIYIHAKQVFLYFLLYQCQACWSHHFLTDFQHGFRHERSCENQLILTVDEIAQALDQGKQIDCILLDFAKPFDKKSHKSLLIKLRHYGFHGSNLGWIQDFLMSRTQVVVVDREESKTAAVTSGVPQGSILRSALFAVYINDLPEKLQSTPRLFADDCLLYRVIESTADYELLQRDLHTLEI